MHGSLPALGLNARAALAALSIHSFAPMTMRALNSGQQPEVSQSTALLCIANEAKAALAIFGSQTRRSRSERTMAQLKSISVGNFASSRRPVHVGDGVKPWFSLLFQTFVAQEHRCAPPEDGRVWRQIAESCSGRTRSSVYICPECGAHLGVSDA